MQANARELPESRNWKAWIDLVPGTGSTLHVTGEVSTAGDTAPKLAEAVPQGIVGTILVLDLTAAGEAGTGDAAFRPVAFERPTGLETFAEVAVRFDAQAVQSIPVEAQQVHPQSPSSS